MMLVAFGCGMIFLHFGVFVDDLSYAVGILLNMLMFISGIFYEVNTTLPEPFNIIMMYCNPVAIVIDTMRNALIYDSAANILQIGIWFLAGLLLCVVGIHTVYKNENAYVKVV
jgi:ABC-type polysaccharide/polyol phosphate export permease